MKYPTLTIILFFTCLTIANAQKVEILLKDGTKRGAQVRTSSETELFIKEGSINYSDIESVRFYSDTPGDRGLKERLSRAGVKISMLEHSIVSDDGYLNDQPKKGDKKIILTCSDSLEVLYKRIGQHLSLKCYAIENANKDFLTIKTAVRETSKYSVSYFLNVLVMKNEINITAQLELNDNPLTDTHESGFSDWEYTHEKKGIFITPNSILYNDLIKNFSDFEKLTIRYE
jgi:hypothetical protein